MPYFVVGSDPMNMGHWHAIHFNMVGGTTLCGIDPSAYLDANVLESDSTFCESCKKALGWNPLPVYRKYTNLIGPDFLKWRGCKIEYLLDDSEHLLAGIVNQVSGMNVLIDNEDWYFNGHGVKEIREVRIRISDAKASK